MASISETGNARNVANFKGLVEHCIAMHPKYQPTNPSILQAAIVAKVTEAEQALQTHTAAKIAYDNATNKRELNFSKMRSLTTRILYALEASGVHKLFIDDARTLARKIRGERAGKINKEEPEQIPVEGSLDPPKPKKRHRSVSQQSYDLRREHFAQLVQLLQSEPLYAPNEADLSIAGLLTYLNDISNDIAQVSTLQANLSTSLGERNHVLYAEKTGLPNLAKAIKAYIKAAFGLNSPEYNAIKGIRIRDVR